MKSVAVWSLILAVAAAWAGFMSVYLDTPPKPRQIPPNPILTEPRVSDHFRHPLSSDAAPPAQRWTGKEGVGVLGEYKK